MATSALSIGSDKGARLQTTPPEHIAEGTTVSTLTILHAETSDSGKYTCLPAQLEAASVNLHVLESKLVGQWGHNRDEQAQLEPSNQLDVKGELEN